MRDKTTITVTTIDGSKSYTIGPRGKAVFIAVCVAVLILTLLSAAGLYALFDEMASFERLKEQHKILLMQSVKVEDKVAEDNSSIAEMDEKIAGIESIVGLISPPKNKKPEKTDMQSRLDAAQMSAAERMLMLRMAPSGMPLEFRGYTSSYGWRYHPLRRTQREFHTGLDLRASIGTPVYATADGVVEVTRNNPAVGFGILVTLSHNFGFKTLYGHLDRALVRQGEFIKKGQLIAYSGNTGYSNGPHLHYEVRYLGKPLDPTPFVEWDLKSYESIFNEEKRVQWDSVAKGVAWQWTLLEQLSSQREPKLQAPSKLSASSTSTGK